MGKPETDVARLTPAELAVIGQYLFGARWRPPLARALNVSLRAVHFWASGQDPIPKRRAVQIAALAAQHAEREISLVRRAYRALLDEITNAEVLRVISTATPAMAEPGAQRRARAAAPRNGATAKSSERPIIDYR
jgi:hypothetical protein